MRSFSRLVPVVVAACALAGPAAAAASSYSDAVIADGPSAYLRMDTGDAWADAVGNLSAGATGGTVLTGQAAAFPNAVAAIRLDNSGGFVQGTLGAAVRTVEMWVKPTSKVKHQPLMSYGDPSGDGWAVATGGPGRRKVTFTSGGHTTTSRLNLPVGVWTMLTVTWGDGANVHMYANATTTPRNNPTAAAGGIPVGAPTDPTLTIGAIGGRTLTAYVDEVALFPTTLSQAQVRAHYAASSLPFNTQLPVVQGTPQVGHQLTVVPGAWGNASVAPYAYQWQHCDDADCDDIAGATGTGYTLVAADEGMTIQVAETASNIVGSTTATSDDVGPIVGVDAPTPDPVGGAQGDGGGGSTSGSGTTTTTVTTAAGSASNVITTCARTLSRGKARRVRVKGIGRVVLFGQVVRVAGTQRAVVTLRAKRRAVASVTFRVDGKKVKRISRGLLRVQIKASGLGIGRHNLRAVIKPRHGKARSVVLQLQVRGC